MRKYPLGLVFTADVTTSRLTTFPQEFTAVVQWEQSNWIPRLTVTVQVLEDRVLRGSVVYQTANFRFRSLTTVPVYKVTALSGIVDSTYTEVPVIEAINYADREYLYDTDFDLIEAAQTGQSTVVVMTQRWG